jgi:hypothetical protein
VKTEVFAEDIRYKLTCLKSYWLPLSSAKFYNSPAEVYKAAGVLSIAEIAGSRAICQANLMLADFKSITVTFAKNVLHLSLVLIVQRDKGFSSLFLLLLLLLGNNLFS